MKTRFTSEAVVALVAAAVMLFGAVLWADRTPGITQADFSVTYVGARMVHLGLGSRLYDLSAQKEIKDSLQIGGKTLIYEHPPFEAFLLSPLGALPYKTAYLLWGLLSALVWLLIPFFLRPYLPTPADNLSYSLLWLLFAPLWISLYVGQSSILMLLLYSVAFVLQKRGHDFPSGVAIGLALLKFQFAIPLLAIFLLRRRWKVVQGFSLTALLLGGLSVVTVGWGGISAYIHLLTAATAHPDSLSYGAAVDMATVQGFVHGVFGKVLGRLLSLLCVAGISSFLIAWAALRGRQRQTQDDNQVDDLMFAAAVVISLITGFHMFTHDLSPMLLSMFIVAANIANCKNRGLRMTLVFCLTVFWLAPIYFLLLAWHCMFLLAPVLVIFAMACIALATNLGLKPAAVEDRTLTSFSGVVQA